MGATNWIDFEEVCLHVGRRNPWERDCTWEMDRLLHAKCTRVTCQKGGQTVALILMCSFSATIPPSQNLPDP